jgi:hypothetical protein
MRSAQLCLQAVFRRCFHSSTAALALASSLSTRQDLCQWQKPIRRPRFSKQ